MNNSIGNTFLEILISMLILSFMLFGLDSMLLYSLHETKTSYYFAVATQQITNLSERLHAYDSKDWQQQVRDWNNQNHSVLPQGRGLLRNDSISVFWGKIPDRECLTNRIGISGCVQMKIKISKE